MPRRPRVPLPPPAPAMATPPLHKAAAAAAAAALSRLAADAVHYGKAVAGALPRLAADAVAVLYGKTAAAAAALPRLPAGVALYGKAATADLPRLAADAVIYGTAAAVWVNGVGGNAVRIFGRWVCGAGSSVEAAGIAVSRACLLVMVGLAPMFIPLAVIRVGKRLQYERREEEKNKERREKEQREKPASNSMSTVALVNEQLPERNRAQPRLPKGVKLTPLHALFPLVQLMVLGSMMELHQDEGSLMLRRMGSVLFDVACVSFAVIISFYAVPSMLILLTIPRVKDGDNVMQ